MTGRRRKKDPVMTTQATRLACTTAVALALSLGLAAPLAAQSSTDTVAIARSEVPGDWSAQMFRGIAFALPPGWQEMGRSDENVIYFGGDVATRTGPGFGLMLEDDPDQTFSGSTIVESGSAKSVVEIDVMIVGKSPPSYAVAPGPPLTASSIPSITGLKLSGSMPVIYCFIKAGAAVPSSPIFFTI